MIPGRPSQTRPLICRQLPSPTRVSIPRMAQAVLEYSMGRGLHIEYSAPTECEYWLVGFFFFFFFFFWWGCGGAKFLTPSWKICESRLVLHTWGHGQSVPDSDGTKKAPFPFLTPRIIMSSNL